MIGKIKSILNSNSLKSQFTRGGIVLSGGAIIESAARFLRNVILTRIIAPEYFGLMAIIMAVIATFQAFTEVGVRQAVIQNKKGSKQDFLNIAWWVSGIRGLILFIIAFFTAPLICEFYNSLELLVPIRVAYIILIFNGILSPQVHVLEKDLIYTKWVIIKQAPALMGIIVAVITAIFLKNIWPLVIGFTLEYFLIFLFSFFIVPFKPSLRFNRTSLNEVLRFARGMFGLPILTAIFKRIDVFAIGKILSMTELGLYAMAQGLAYAPAVIFAKIIRPLVLPMFSKIQDNKIALKQTISKIIKIVAMITLPLITYFIIFSKQILILVYGPKYGAVSFPFSLLMLNVVVVFYSTIFMQLFFALGHPELQRNYALIRVVIGIGLIYPATKYYGLSGAALTVFISMLVLFILQLHAIKKLIDYYPKDFLKCVLPGLMFSLIIIVPGITLKYLFKVDAIIEVSFGFILCIILWIITFNDFIFKTFNIKLISFKKMND